MLICFGECRSENCAWGSPDGGRGGGDGVGMGWGAGGGAAAFTRIPILSKGHRPSLPRIRDTRPASLYFSALWAHAEYPNGSVRARVCVCVCVGVCGWVGVVWVSGWVGMGPSCT